MRPNEPIRLLIYIYLHLLLEVGQWSLPSNQRLNGVWRAAKVAPLILPQIMSLLRILGQGRPNPVRACRNPVGISVLPVRYQEKAVYLVRQKSRPDGFGHRCFRGLLMVVRRLYLSCLGAQIVACLGIRGGLMFS